MSAVTIVEDVNSYASISQEDTTARACKATLCRVMTHLVKVYSINPLSPKRDQHQISLCNINAW